ncbi:antirestriction protein ArdA [Roseibium sp. AS2]|uniref:antirestriction protein ArdA n=1 Tax=Roseibium sp. AS2 TaxID=3135781 RepID=UPI00317CEAC8
MSPRLLAAGPLEDSVYYAQPYSIEATGFYFSSLEEYEAKTKGHTDRFGMPVEEYELQFIDGDNHRLFNALGISQATLAVWFETFAELDVDDDDYLKAVYLAENGYNIDEIPDRIDDVSIYRGRAVDYAEELITECYDIPVKLEYYIDYEAFARDMAVNGDFNVMETDQGEVLVFGP